MENNNDFNQEKKENITISKKSLYIVGGVALALVLLIGGYFAFSNKNEAKDTVVKNDSLAVKKDSTTIKADSLKNSEKNGNLMEKREDLLPLQKLQRKKDRL